MDCCIPKEYKQKLYLFSKIIHLVKFMEFSDLPSTSNAKKRKHIEDPPDKTENRREMPYILDHIRALQKKLDSTTQDNHVTLKGKEDNIQIVIVCNTATYELVKSVFQSSLREQNLYTSLKTNRDQSKAVVTVIVNVKTKKKGKSLYTANFYNTTSTILVNGLKDPNLFLNHYSEMIDKIPATTIKMLNESIKKSCSEAIDNSSLKRVNASEISLPASTSTPLNQDSNTSIDMSESLLPGECENCNQMKQTLKTMMERISNLEENIKQQNIHKVHNKIDESYINKVLEEKMQTFSLSFNNKLESKLECFSRLEKEINLSRTHSYRDAAATKTTTKSTNKINEGASTSTAGTLSFQAHTHNIKKKQQNIEFQPEKCVVINTTQAADIRSIKHDTIRHEFSRNFGPIMIDTITPYKFLSEHPKYMIQLSNIDDVKKVVMNWKDKNFGGSSVRTTIKPDTSKVTGMMKGVPLDISDKDIQQSVENLHPGSTTVRLSKENQKLRTVKINFKDKEMLSIAVQNGILFPSCNMLFRVQQPFENQNKS